MSTEDRNLSTVHISEVSTEEMLRLINNEDRKVADVVAECIPAVTALVEAAVTALQSRHRVIYCGAGTSGRLGVVDAAECPPTYGLSPDKFVAVMAGGRDAVFRAAEGFEDSREAGLAAFEEASVVAGDLVIGISVSGQAPFVLAFVQAARECGCTVAAITNNTDAPILPLVDIAVVADTGAEVIKGSTRMKGGTAQKMILNMFSTAVCIRMGYVYQNYMVNMKVSNRKLRHRAVTMVAEITGESREAAEALLVQHGWEIRAALEAYFDKGKERQL